MTKLKAELTCRKCGACWKYTGTQIATKCPFCGANKDARDRREDTARYAKSAARKEGLKRWAKDNPEHQRQRCRTYAAIIRKRAFFRICGSISPTCVRCGCDDARLLEINHKNGGGNRELENGRRSNAFYRGIAKGTRSTDDLELLCKPCNAVHALELKYGSLPFRVIWNHKHGSDKSEDNG